MVDHSKIIRKTFCLSFVVMLLCGSITKTCAQELHTYQEIVSPKVVYSEIDTTHIFSQIEQGNVVSRNNEDSAIAILKTVIRRSTNFFDGLVEGSYFLGIIYMQKGHYDTAREWLQQALFYSSRGHRSAFKGSRILNNIGNTYKYQGNYKMAAAYFFYAVELAEKTVKFDPAIANPLVRIYTNAGASLLQLNEYNKAMYYFEKAEVMARVSKFTTTLPSTWANMAIVYNKTGQQDKAWEYNLHALSMAQHYNQVEIETTILQNMAILMQDKNKPDSAIYYLKKALAIKLNINPYYTTAIRYALGSIYLQLKDYPNAAYYLNEAYKQAQHSAIPEHILNLHRQFALLYSTAGEYQKAFEHQQAAYTLNDSLLNREKTTEVDVLEIKYRTAEKDKKIAQNQQMIYSQTVHLRQKNIWIYGIAACAILCLLFVFMLYKGNQHKQKIKLLKAVIEGEEKERSRLARELHDGVGGVLSAITMNVTLLGKENKQASQSPTYRNVLQMLHDISNEIRKTAHNLMPEILIRHSLPEAVRLFCNHINKENIEIDIEAYGPFESLEQNMRLNVYRMIQELMQNVIKHAQASYVLVQLILQKSTLYIMVEDNGIGISNTTPAEGMGLQSMESRVRSQNGQFTIESETGKGTTICIEFELQETVKTSDTQINNNTAN